MRKKRRKELRIMDSAVLKKYMKKKYMIVAGIAILLILAAVLCLVFGVFGGGKKPKQEKKPQVTHIPSVTAMPTPSGPAAEITNPINFEQYHAINPDVYAYIYIANTKVDYPILQHPSDNAYYLDYTIEGKKGLPGSIYTEIENSKSFTDPNTVIYGHNMKNGTMFKTIHKYEDEAFFNANRSIYIYTPTQILQYQIFAAYTYSDDRIVYWYNFSDPADCQRYLDMVKETAPKKGHFDAGIPLTISDKIITLVTCTGNSSTRWLVQAKLVQAIPCPAGTTVTVRDASAEALSLEGCKPLGQ